MCGLSKDASEFGHDPRYKDGLRSYCYACCQRRVRAWRKRNPLERISKDRNSKLKSKHGITQREYEVMLANQGGKCAICGLKPKAFDTQLVVDHDHFTGKIRGLLCQKCNLGLGHFDDDVNSLNMAIKYLEAQKE